MGLLQEGHWVDNWYDTNKTSGRFVRQAPQFRNWITSDGSPGPSGDGGFPAEAGRYHLYVSLACPWAHRTLIFRALKGLEDMISVSIVHWYMADKGWTFQAGDETAPDTVNDAKFLHQVYTAAKSDYSGRVTVPVLWDKKGRTIVSNESPEIIRMLNSAFDGIGAKSGDYYPSAFRDEIEVLNQRIYDTVNNGVYKAGFATTQEAYEEAIVPLFETLDWLDDKLAKQRYLIGSKVTEADWRLFATLVRFDPVYVGHFKCNLRRIADYKNLSGYVRDLYQQPGIAATVNMAHIKKHYYASHETLNPSRIVPTGPLVDYSVPHDRDALG
ncbi:glutathione S-transferase family protein [Pseudopelagicola sp. nBUS_20]|uniref:glutathione S-transferase family protein n=1 Tax=Pseudopelagicola sp. nBUS_20 TaxID=3395317 RepID=UPI003EBDB39F